MFNHNISILHNIFYLSLASWIGLLGVILLGAQTGVIAGVLTIILINYIPLISTYKLKKIARKYSLNDIIFAEGNIDFSKSKDSSLNGQLFLLNKELIFTTNERIELVIPLHNITNVEIERVSSTPEEQVPLENGKELTHYLLQQTLPDDEVKLCVEMKHNQTKQKHYFAMFNARQWKSKLCSKLKKSVKVNQVCISPKYCRKHNGCLKKVN